MLVVITLFAFYQIALSKDIKDLLAERLLKSESNLNKKERRGKVRNKWARALGGMVIEGTVGLMFRPVGVIIEGVVGAVVGNQIEYESIKAEKR
jgi:hypothetical protein